MSSYQYYYKKALEQQILELKEQCKLLITADLLAFIGTGAAIALNNTDETQTICKYMMYPFILGGTVLAGAITKDLNTNKKMTKKLTNKYNSIY